MLPGSLYAFFRSDAAVNVNGSNYVTKSQKDRGLWDERNRFIQVAYSSVPQLIARDHHEDTGLPFVDLFVFGKIFG